MYQAQPHDFLVPFDNSFRNKHASTLVDGKAGAKELKKALAKENEKLRELQRVLYADDRHSVLLVFQAMDAAGKDSTIRAVMSGINPAGCQVFSFKQPSAEELDHDFLWRTTMRLPERGRIGVFNRSYYEEVLVVRVHPQYLNYQKLPHRHVFMQLDGIVHLDLDQNLAVGLREVHEDEFWVSGHIPGRPLFPGILMLETAAQMASFLSGLVRPDDRFQGFGGLDGVKFRAAVSPPATMHIIEKLVEVRPRRTICDAQGYVDNRLVFEARITGMPI